MKTSQYNWVIDEGSVTIAYNGFTGAISEVDKEYSALFNDVITVPNIKIRKEDIDNELFVALQDNGYIIEDDFDEYKFLKMLSTINRYTEKELGVTAVMTKGCNFACEYCYESAYAADTKKMKPEVISAIAGLIDSCEEKSWELVLYGGEPLIAYNECLELLKKCKEKCRIKDIELNAGIITNGFLLSEEKARVLSEHGVSHAQITVDGSRETHNKRRPLKDGANTYDIVVKNAKTASKYLYVAIRMNAENEYANDYEELKKEFKDYGNISIYVAATAYEHCGNHEKTKANELAVLNEIHPKTLLSENTHAILGGCGAILRNARTICPDGTMVRCWEELAFQESSGNIVTNPKSSLMDFYKWLKWDPFSQESMCSTCKMLPNCGGGCPIYWVKNKENKCMMSQSKMKKYIIANYRKLVSEEP